MGTLAVFQQLGWGELVIIFFIVMLLFGAKRLPEMAKSLGKAKKEFEEGVKGLSDDVKSGLSDEEAQASGASKDKRSSAGSKDE